MTVVDAKTGSTVHTPIDLTNRTGLSSYYHFGKHTKIEYFNGKNLNLTNSTYIYQTPRTPLPNIIHSGVSPANIDVTRSYFSRKTTIEQIASLVGMPYDTLINGDYKLIIEPIIYLTYKGSFFAMTAHETALYDELVNGDIWNKFNTISHKNLPLALFMDKGGFGIPAWKGTTTGKVNNSQIKKALGIGIVSFKPEEEEEPEPPTEVVPDPSGRLTGIGGDVYRVNTDVITSFWVTDDGSGSDTKSGISPDDRAILTITIGDTAYHVPFVVPPNDTTLVWVKWRTPSTPQTMAITADANFGTVAESRKNVSIIALNLAEPPNPEGRDLRDGWVFENVILYPEEKKNSWNEWDPYWVPNIVMTPFGPVDMGWWEYDPIFYEASLSIEQKLSTYSKTAQQSYQKIFMKSGYGVYIDAAAYVNTQAAHSNFTQAQTVITAFPEFKYRHYFRILEPNGAEHFRFQKNPFSQFEDNLHFTPLWYPDRQAFPVQVVTLDCWTPAGMLTRNYFTENMVIEGNVYDDWYIAPTK